MVAVWGRSVVEGVVEVLDGLGKVLSFAVVVDGSVLAALRCLRWSRRRLDGLPVADVYVGAMTVVLEVGGITLGSVVVCEDTLGSSGAID